MMTILVLAFAAVCTVQAQDCSLVTEVNKIMHKMIREFVPDKNIHDVYIACFTAFVTGDSSKCDTKTFKLPQTKVCEDVIQHNDLQKNEISSTSPPFFHRLICEKMRTEGDKFLAKLRKLQEGGGAQAKKMYDKICKNDIKKCEEIKEMPEEIEKYIMEDSITQYFKYLNKILKNTEKPKTMPAAGAATEGIDLMFGSDVSKCVKEIITIATKLRKQLQVR